MKTHLRVARPTDNLDLIVEMYRVGLDLDVLGSFKDHQGFDGIMLGKSGMQYHFEFTHHRGHKVGKAPTQDNLLVFYVPDRAEWEAACARMELAGFMPVPSYNPYWDQDGRTFEDADGYRVVLENGEWE
ncbi:VOC family protein [Candidatus Villigracilis affinis]|uniref:VOC family protein n=1 Tax=Candidatus Villigracilis affinis TaxID=3140682 RepID=UPI002A20447A|nr:VOC family protein [Anaerolineales bacterium]